MTVPNRVIKISQLNEATEIFDEDYFQIVQNGENKKIPYSIFGSGGGINGRSGYSGFSGFSGSTGSSGPTGISGFSGFSGFSGASSTSGSGAGYNVMDAPYSASGTGLSNPLSSSEAAEYNAEFGEYGLVVSAGDEKDWAAIQGALYRAANTGSQVYIPAGMYYVNKPIVENWTATPVSGQPSIPKCTRITGDGKNTIIYGTNIASGRGIFEFLGENNYQYSADVELSHMTIEADASCSSGSYCIRAGDAWCGLNFHRLNCLGANGIMLKVASSISYAQLCTQFTQVNIWTNWGSRWYASESDAAVYAVNNESGGALFDNCGFYECVFRGLVNLRANIANYIGCQFVTPSQRPVTTSIFNCNVLISLGAAMFKGCYFEDHKTAVIATCGLSHVYNLDFDGCVFSGVQNFGGPDADYAINAFGSTGTLSHVNIRNCRFRTIGYTVACISLVGCNYTIDGVTDYVSPGVTQVTISAPFARGTTKQLNSSLTYDVMDFNNIRPEVDIFKGGSTFKDNVNGFVALTVENESTSGAFAASSVLFKTGDLNTVVSLLGEDYQISGLERTFSFSTDSGVKLGFSPGGVPFLYMIDASGTPRLVVGSTGDDGANQAQFNNATRLEGIAHSFGIVSANYTMPANRQRVDATATCTITLAAANAWGSAISGCQEVHNISSSTGVVTVVPAGSDEFRADMLLANSITLRPGESARFESNGQSPGLWTVSITQAAHAVVKRFSSTAFSSFSDNDAELNIIPTGVGNLTVKYSVPGTTYEVRAGGVYTNVAASEITIRFKLDVNTVATFVVPLTDLNSSGSWFLESIGTVLANSDQVAWTVKLNFDGLLPMVKNLGVYVTQDSDTPVAIGMTAEWTAADPSNFWATTNFLFTETT